MVLKGIQRNISFLNGSFIYDICQIFIHSGIFFCISGNIFVIAAIVLERNLQGVANYLILSLAVADLLVAVLVMPLAAVYEVSKMICFQIL